MKTPEQILKSYHSIILEDKVFFEEQYVQNAMKEYAVKLLKQLAKDLDNGYSVIAVPSLAVSKWASENL